MSIALTTDERLALLESEVARLKQAQLNAEPKQNWIERISGTFKNDAEFGEILRLGREIRKAECSGEVDGAA